MLYFHFFSCRCEVTIHLRLKMMNQSHISGSSGVISVLARLMKRPANPESSPSVPKNPSYRFFWEYIYYSEGRLSLWNIQHFKTNHLLLSFLLVGLLNKGQYRHVQPALLYTLKSTHEISGHFNTFLIQTIYTHINIFSYKLRIKTYTVMPIQATFKSQKC